MHVLVNLPQAVTSEMQTVVCADICAGVPRIIPLFHSNLSKSGRPYIFLLGKVIKYFFPYFPHFIKSLRGLHGYSQCHSQKIVGWGGHKRWP